MSRVFWVVEIKDHKDTKWKLHLVIGGMTEKEAKLRAKNEKKYYKSMYDFRATCYIPKDTKQ